MNSSKCYRIKKKTVLISTGLLALCLSKALMAAMPTAVTKGSYSAGSGDWLAMLTGYIDSGTDPLAWGIVIMTFFVVAVILLFVIFIVTQATTVI